MVVVWLFKHTLGQRRQTSHGVKPYLPIYSLSLPVLALERPSLSWQ